jgi:hypothetical protein
LLRRVCGGLLQIWAAVTSRHSKPVQRRTNRQRPRLV